MRDKRNLYGGQYRFSKEFAEEINSKTKFKKTFAHDMSAWEDVNHFDVQNILIQNNIYKRKLTQINNEANMGNPKRWNTERGDLLIKGIKKLGKKYEIPLENPSWRSDGTIRIAVKQKLGLI